MVEGTPYWQPMLDDIRRKNPTPVYEGRPCPRCGEDRADPESAEMCWLDFLDDATGVPHGGA